MASLTTQQIQTYLHAFNFKDLFIQELGWNILREKPFSVTVKEQTYTLHPLAEQQGFKVYQCSPNAQGQPPDDSRMRQIEREVTKYGGYEHIIIYRDREQTHQAWQWVKREQGKPLAPRLNKLHKGQSGALLAQKLLNIEFSVLEETTLTNVSNRVRSAFDVEKVTKRFYDRFQKEHGTFLDFIQGIQDQGDRAWYTSIMLNRLMFIYFIQRQGFLDTSSDEKLDGQHDYLRQRLAMTRAQQGPNTFHTFYRYFLLKLFHEGLSKRERTPELDRLLGRVPYLNGGLFDVHQLEQANPAIEIADAAFEHIFDFFDDYDWHLDDRANKSGNEINPDVLGYIFEKYINQKQMGAYYTKEDITEYISKNTILPYLLETTRQHCEVAFRPDGPVWSLLRDNPDEYIYEAVAKGTQLSLPEEIAAGLHDISQRGAWNKPAPDEYALPTEIWREVIARRTRHDEVRAKLLAGDITDINDLITYNLDIRKFTHDLIAYCEGTDLLRAFYDQITKVTVLDPTCGSGAFLFAALNILEPLYEACLIRMETKVAEHTYLHSTRPAQHRRTPRDIEQFQSILHEVGRHPNRAYFILKSIIINNLYGVDIMEEATEICKLRLFLKLVSQVHRYNEIEPLPDIDFNIRAGNTLVGFTTLEEVSAIVSKDLRSALTSADTLEEIKQKAQEIERGFKNFRDLQTRLNLAHEDIAGAKQQLRTQLAALNDQLDRYLAAEYGIDENNIQKRSDYQQKFRQWQHSHQPFHWYAQFYEIMHNGGFGVIIGNPPYVEYSKIKQEYKLLNYFTLACGNIYAFLCERSHFMMAPLGRAGLIVPLSIVSTERMGELQSLLQSNQRTNWLSSYDVYPSKLFDGAKQRLTILLTSSKDTNSAFLTSNYKRWKPQERTSLFPTLAYWGSMHESKLCVIPKLGEKTAENILRKIHQYKSGNFAKTSTNASLYVHRIPYNYVKALDFTPYFWNEIDGEKKSEDYKIYFLSSLDDTRPMLAALNSNLFFWWWYTLFEGYHCGKHEIEAFPIGLEVMSGNIRQELHELTKHLMADFRKNSFRKEAQYKTTGKVIYDELYPKRSKPIIDEIDRVLARHYGFTDEELDFIINYDIKYRMGRDNGEEEE